MVTALFIEPSSDVGVAQLHRQVYRSTTRITSTPVPYLMEDSDPPDANALGGDVKKLLPIGIIVVPVVAFAGFLWVAEVHDRADASQVTRAAYARFGSGPRIVCVAQDRNSSTWYCSSPRWGDDPNCRTASVSVTGSIDFADQTRACE
jgi:hypothetical protein